MADLSKVEWIVQDIYDIKIQGATNIAKAAFQILIDELERQDFKSDIEVKEFMMTAMDKLEKARPTEPMMFNGMDYIRSKISEYENKVKNWVELDSSLRSEWLMATTCYLNMIHDTAKKAIENGKDILEYGQSVLTHCHSSGATKTIIANREWWREIFVYNTETRPLFQGHKTAKDFLDAGMKITMIVDSSAAFILDKDDPFGIDIDAVIIGCDAIKLNGDIINKVGTYSIAHAARDNKIPVYIAGNLLKTDVKDSIQIETRNPKEIWEDMPEWLEIMNFAFDQVPAKYITGIITEFGIIKPEAVRKSVKEFYPWMK